MSVNKKSISSQALLEMNEIKNAIKEESKNTIKAMLAEAVKKALRDEIEDEDDDLEIYDGDEKCPDCGEKLGSKECCRTKDGKKKDAEGKGGKKSGKKDSGELDEVGEDEQVPAEDGQAAQNPAMNAQMQNPAMAQQGAQQAPAQGEGAEGQDDFMAQYQAGDEDTLDLTGEQDIQNVLKVYKALSDDDQVVVRREGDMINLQDNGTGAEYIIDLGADEAGAEEEPAMEDGEAEQLAEEYMLEIGDDDSGYEEDNFEENPDNDMMNEQEMMFEIDLGYTDNYQDKDPIDGLNNSEPSKSGRSWHKGIPTGTEKSWAGKGTEKKGDPFDNSVNENLTELDDDYFAAGLNDTGVAEVETEDGMPFDKKVGSVDENHTTSKYQKRHKVKTRGTNSGDKDKPKRSKSTSIEDNYDAELEEAVSKLRAKNKKLNEAVKDLHSGLKEAYMTNVNLGKITKLFLENTTTQAEKLQIVERFSNEAKTPKQAQALYESISKQLASSKKSTIDESKANGKPVMTESKAPVYKSQDLLDTIDLMNRVLNC